MTGGLLACYHAAVWIRDSADDGGKQEKTIRSISQVAEENTSCVMAPQNYKQKCNGEDGTGGHGEHHREEKTMVAIGHVWRMYKDRRANQIGFLREEEKRKTAEELDRDR